MASRRDKKSFTSEVIEIESLLLNLKQRTKRKLADCDSDVNSQDSWNKDAFFQRVQTFSITTWFGKPSELSPLQCAKYGWINSESDMLQCVVCRAVICAALPVNYDPKVYQSCVKKLTDKLTSAHEYACKWRSNPTPDSLIRVPTHSKAEVKEEFNKRLQSLLPCGNKLPYINITTMETQGVTDETLITLVQHQLISSSREGTEDLEIMKRASAISLCGWKNRSDDVEDILSCDFCRRNIGLWNYKSPHWYQTYQESECDTAQNSSPSLTEPVSQNKYQNGVGKGNVNSGENKSPDHVLESSANVDQGQSESSDNGASANDGQCERCESDGQCERCESDGDKGNNSISETHSGSTEETTNMDIDDSELTKNKDVKSSEDSLDMLVVQTCHTCESGSNDNASPARDSDDRDSNEDKTASPARDSDGRDSNEDKTASPARDSEGSDSNEDKTASPARDSEGRDSNEDKTASPARDSDDRDSNEDKTASPARYSDDRDSNEDKTASPAIDSDDRDSNEDKTASPARYSDGRDSNEDKTASPARDSDGRDSNEDKTASPARYSDGRDSSEDKTASPARDSEGRDLNEDIEDKTSPVKDSDERDLNENGEDIASYVRDSEGRDSNEDIEDKTNPVRDSDKRDLNEDKEDIASSVRDSDERDLNEDKEDIASSVRDSDWRADKDGQENEDCDSTGETRQKSQSETDTNSIKGTESSCELVKSNGCSEETKGNITANGVDTKGNFCPLSLELNHDQKDLHTEEEDSENENTIPNGETESKSETGTDSDKDMKSGHDAVKSNSCSEEEMNGGNTKAVATEETGEALKSPDMPPGAESINGPSDIGELPRKRLKLEEKDSFDPLAEHRTWCPWLQKSCDTSPWKQSKSDELLPWKKILNMVCPHLKEKNPREMSLSFQYKEVSPVVALERVRRILNDWTDMHD
ncbi:protein starmaker-like [Ostrea edulis]|uniref:protein starmaker-like n=1 Tax=Ostrea edulis TaxID=37623 RepID=UPI0024AF4EEE|nr:protein starmaker-like [Ostrea edulis]